MDEQGKVFEGYKAENGKQFPFVRVTVAKQAKVINKFKIPVWNILFKIYCAFTPARNNLRMWKKVRSVAFVKSGLWKYLRIIPKELRCSEMQLKLAGELQASFFGYVEAEVKGHDAPLLSLKGSPIENNKAKEGD